MGGGGIGYVNAPSTSTGVKEGIAAIVGGPIQGNGSRGSVPWTTVYTWSDLMSILSILFSGEERGMI